MQNDIFGTSVELSFQVAASSILICCNSILGIGVFGAQGKLSEAEPLCCEALRSLRAVLGDERPDTPFCFCPS